jgi:hypothetical protein
VVVSDVIEDKPTAEPAADEQPAGPAESPPEKRRWTMPAVALSPERKQEIGRAATSVGIGLAGALRRVGAGVLSIATFGWRLVRQVSPIFQLLGALALGLMLSIAGSVTLGNALGRTCAIVFVPAFALALGAAVHHWYLRSTAKSEAEETPTEAPATLDLQRAVEYVDGKLAFALNALGTDRQQQAVIALIQAKTATELSFGTGEEPVRPSQRPRIRVGPVAKASSRESVSIAGLA